MDSCRHSVHVNCAPRSGVMWVPKRAIQLLSTGIVSETGIAPVHRVNRSMTVNR